MQQFALARLPAISEVVGDRGGDSEFSFAVANVEAACCFFAAEAAGMMVGRLSPNSLLHTSGPENSKTWTCPLLCSSLATMNEHN